MNSRRDMIEYEDWLPAVLNAYENHSSWGKHHAAFLRFCFAQYNIPVTVYTRKTAVVRGRNYYTIHITLTKYCRTHHQKRVLLDDIHEICTAFRYDSDTTCKVYATSGCVWEANPAKGLQYFLDVMCIGLGSVPWMPKEIRFLVISAC